MSKTTQNTPAPVVDTSTSQAPPTTPAPQIDTPTVQTAETPAEVVYQPEGSLPPITSLDDLSHIRAIDKQGRSVTMPPAQIRELTGIDYSKLEEQIVPGEYWVGADGVRKQVYTRTFIGTNSPSSFPYSISGQEYPCAWSFYEMGLITECRLIYSSIGGCDIVDPASSKPNYIWRGLDLWFKEVSNPRFNNVDYVLIFKFTKA